MKCLALFSGGLDSMLAIKLMSLQGIEVMALNINIGFGSKTDVSETMRRRAKIAGADFAVIDVRETYLKEILFSPKYGYGKNFNPCIDCHGFMFKTAKSLLKTYDASFLITGEVLGQRPMSQRSNAIKSVTKLSGDEENLILRPLCAKLMEPTKPELEGWVDREKLFDISGRSRERQLALAESFGWEDFEKPGGGCLLTDINFAKKMRDFIKFDTLQVADIDVLKNGRQLRLPDNAKLIIGRDEAENKRIENIKNDKYLFIKAQDIPGPSALLRADASENDKKLALQAVLSFSKTENGKKYDIICGENLLQESPHPNKESLYQYLIT
ncbi:argininosuccinate synthase domain-containing protein [Sulfurospirillum sp. 1612]|uniref:argininosuccinate synthase domain-containing protein n=1 Tax=Sulfurospirillum sp. 1612 TaxID=3094835 RepID=UPI002F955F78